MVSWTSLKRPEGLGELGSGGGSGGSAAHGPGDRCILPKRGTVSVGSDG